MAALPAGLAAETASLEPETTAPRRQRRQTTAVVIWILLIPACVGVFCLALMHRYLMPLMVLYLVFVALDATPETGGRQLPWVRQWRLWKWQRSYFPIRLVKTCELDPSKNYIFGYHPHGIISLGAWINFATEANDFSRLFPGITVRLLTIASNFRVPFFRELLLSLGLASVSRRSCDNILSMGPGHSCLIVVGGAAEALMAFPYTNDLILRRRHGFIRLALRRGASLVPCYSFGENDLWDQVPNPEGSWLRAWQRFMQKYTTVSPPLFFGRGVGSTRFGIVPFRRPVTTVVGAPIPCVQTADPAPELVQAYHQRYTEALQALWEQHHPQYAPNYKTALTLTE
ncbi:hypothetical protein CXG81DRAFT_11356 [Caulochytrium protostelioides]|uniref:Diacylglycerol O-acyltransferase n=1 Tax=Caulochytrium protostelioides TaxID=1555241 RepID=A0A4P9WXN4_9FUNG|nr:diacylglycerol acyltransferase [Caulochytrium protostelioides]RKP01974.1 hypothetical protein CXG81DRAFT_11356 [Caulochytrium protostelioides]|eukprot:RKP01974.1 hypothetical protein CXG81DRAFT_11356 [Caulochytrium protostelioides]